MIKTVMSGIRFRIEQEFYSEFKGLNEQISNGLDRELEWETKRRLNPLFDRLTIVGNIRRRV